MELGGMGVGGRVGGVTEDEVEAEVRWCCSTGLGNDCAVWKQDAPIGRAHSVAGEGSAVRWASSEPPPDNQGGGIFGGSGKVLNTQRERDMTTRKLRRKSP